MPNLKNIGLKNQKRLDITEYCQDILDEGETVVYITIKKMSNVLKRKITLFTTEKYSSETNQALFDGIADSSLTISEIQNYEKLPAEKQKEIIKIYKKANINLDEKKNLFEMEGELERLIIEECVDPENHNFFDDKGKKIDISDYNFWNALGKLELSKFIVKSIREFSEDFFFKKPGEMASDGQSETIS